MLRAQGLSQGPWELTASSPFPEGQKCSLGSLPLRLAGQNHAGPAVGKEAISPTPLLPLRSQHPHRQVGVGTPVLSDLEAEAGAHGAQL